MLWYLILTVFLFLVLFLASLGHQQILGLVHDDTLASNVAFWT